MSIGTEASFPTTALFLARRAFRLLGLFLVITFDKGRTADRMSPSQ